jgi:hypothetical protein
MGRHDDRPRASCGHLPRRRYLYSGGIGYAAYNNWPAVVSFVARNADALKEFVIAEWRNPALVEIIDRIARTLL